jgi:hypothetical protein
VGWCVRDGNLDDLRAALRTTHIFWGGRYNPLIPVGSGLAEQLVKLFRVDVLLPASDTASIKDFIARFPHLRWPFTWDEPLVDLWGEGKMPLLADVSHAAQHAVKDNAEHEDLLEMHSAVVDWQSEDELADVLLATFGAFPTDAVGDGYREMFARYCSTNRYPISPEREIPASIAGTLTPSALSAYRLDPDYSSSWHAPGVYVGKAGHFTDLLTYWNLRASGVRLFFFDPALSGRLTPIVDAFIERLTVELAPLPEARRHLALWSTDQSLAPPSLGSTSVLRNVADDVTWNGLNLRPPLMYFGPSQTTLGSVDDAVPPFLSVQLGDRPFFQTPYQLSHQHCVLEVRPTTVSDAGLSEHTFWAPPIPEINSHLARASYLLPSHARVGRDGLGVVIDIGASHVVLRALRNEDLLTEVFASVGIEATPSHPGLIARRLLQQMGGVQGCRVFKIAGVRRLIDQYGPDQSFTRSAANQTIRDLNEKTGKVGFEQYEDLFIEQRSKGKLTHDDVLAYLLRKRVFRVGLEFLCPNCRLTFWLPLDSAKTVVECEYCGSPFDVSPQLRDRDWRYRRSGLFGRDDNQQGAVPVVLTLQQLDTHLHGFEGSVMSTGWNLAIQHAGAFEVDLVVLNSDPAGKPQIAVGEAKTNDIVTDDDVAHLVRACEAFPVSAFDTFIIVAKTGAFSEAEVETCRKAALPHRDRVIMLSGRDLEPYFILEKVQRALDAALGSASLKGLAAVTRATYLTPNPKEAAHRAGAETALH